MYSEPFIIKEMESQSNKMCLKCTSIKIKGNWQRLTHRVENRNREVLNHHLNHRVYSCNHRKALTASNLRKSHTSSTAYLSQLPRSSLKKRRFQLNFVFFLLLLELKEIVEHRTWREKRTSAAKLLRLEWVTRSSTESSPSICNRDAMNLWDFF